MDMSYKKKLGYKYIKSKNELKKIMYLDNPIKLLLARYWL